MIKIISVIFLLLNSLLFSQSDQEFINRDVLTKDESLLLPITASNLQVIKVPEWHDMITNVPANIYSFFCKSFVDDNLPLLGIISASTTTLVMTDARTHSIIKNFCYRNSSFNNFEKSIVYLGDGRTDFGIAGLFALYGLTFSDNVALRTGMQSSESILSTGLTVQLIKRITGRESPCSASSGSGVWRIFPNIIKYQKNQAKYYSFPSGHLSTAVTTLTVIADNYPDSKFITPVGCSLVGLLGVGLVSADMHWLSDFPLALALGYGFGKLITNANYTVKAKKDESNSIIVSFMPVFQQKQTGVGMLMSF
ncbi:MAG: phosphatase PAP2 family protein [Ignavibacteriaceae bacterium]|nr:phosphatase PAP2 family protein [Ignavibacteriaceae bacterium]